MRNVARVLIVLVFLPLACSSLAGGCSGQGSSPAPLPPLSADRLRDLQRAMCAVGREETLQRALKESGPYLSQFPVLVESILKGSAWEYSGHTRALMLSALGKARGQAVQPIIVFYQDASSDKRLLLRPVFGRIGKDAQAAAPVLRAELGKAQTSAEDKMSIKVVLAAMGQATSTELDEIAATLSVDSKVGLRAMWTMCECGHNPWLPESVEKPIIKIMEKPRLTPDNLQQGLRSEACLALTTFGERTDAHVLKALQDEYDGVVRDAGAPPEMRLWAGLGLAKADSSHRRAMMLSILKEVPGSMLAWQVRPLMEWMCAGMPDDDLLWVADALLSEQKHEPLSAALVILYAVGPRARSAVPRLVSLIRLTDDDSTKTAAAQTLGMVADPLDLPLIENLVSDAALSDDAKEAVQECIRAVTLHD